MNVTMTLHASLRCAQRRVRPEDLDLAMRLGTFTEDGILVRDADVQPHLAELKQQMNRLERLKGLYIACPGEAVVTVYRPSRRREKRILRNEMRHDRA